MQVASVLAGVQTLAVGVASLVDGVGVVAVAPAYIVVGGLIATVALLTCWTIGPRNRTTVALPHGAAVMAITASTWSESLGGPTLAIALGAVAGGIFFYALWAWLRSMRQPGA